MYEKRMTADEKRSAFVPKSITVEDLVYLIVTLKYPESALPDNTNKPTP